MRLLQWVAGVLIGLGALLAAPGDAQAAEAAGPNLLGGLVGTVDEVTGALEPVTEPLAGPLEPTTREVVDPVVRVVDATVGPTIEEVRSTVAPVAPLPALPAPPPDPGHLPAPSAPLPDPPPGEPVLPPLPSPADRPASPSESAEPIAASERHAVAGGEHEDRALQERGGEAGREERHPGADSRARSIDDARSRAASLEAPDAAVEADRRSSSGSRRQQDGGRQHGTPAAGTGSASRSSSAGGSPGGTGGPVVASLPATPSSPLAAGSLAPRSRVADPPPSLAERPETSPD